MAEGKALVFFPRLVYKLEKTVIFHALFISLLKIANSHDLMEASGLIRRGRTMAQGHGKFQRVVESPAQRKAKAIPKSMKGLSINKMGINHMYYVGAWLPLPARTPITRH